LWKRRLQGERMEEKNGKKYTYPHKREKREKGTCVSHVGTKLNRWRVGGKGRKRLVIRKKRKSITPKPRLKWEALNGIW